MSNIPENEKRGEQIPEVTENPADTPSFDEAEFSTVFGDPVEHKKTAADKRKKKYILNIIAGVFIVAALATTLWAVKKFIPEMIEETNSSSPFHENSIITETDESDSSTAVSAESDDLESVIITKEDGTIKFYSTTETVENDSSIEGTASTSDVVTWHIEGVDDSYISTSDIATFIGQVGRITVVKEMTDMTDAECGIDTPVATIKLTRKDGKSFTMILGNPAFGGNYYGKMSDTDKLYMVTQGYCDEILNTSIYDFSGTTYTPAYTAPDGADDYLSDDGTLTYFDTLTVKSKSFDETLVFETTNDDLSSIFAYKVTSPSERIAQNAEYILALFQSGISVEGTYTYGVSAEQLKAYGLDDPDFEATIDVMGKTMTYKFKLQDDGNCAVVTSESDVICKISSSINMSGDSTNPLLLSDMFNYDVTDFYAYWITLYNIGDIANLTFTVDGEVYSCDITENPDETSEDTYIVTINGTQVDCQSFQYLYQFCISIACDDYTVDELTDEPSITFDFTFDDTSMGNTVVEFTRAGASRYQYSIGGIPMGKTTSAEMNKFVKYLEKVAAGEIIDEIV